MGPDGKELVGNVYEFRIGKLFFEPEVPGSRSDFFDNAEPALVETSFLKVFDYAADLVCVHNKLVRKGSSLEIEHSHLAAGNSRELSVLCDDGALQKEEHPVVRVIPEIAESVGTDGSVAYKIDGGKAIISYDFGRSLQPSFLFLFAEHD